tara:strand:+ start:1296 stop:1727 length:432 start_codon:yes stop_codon:yes gene_type:complete
MNRSLKQIIETIEEVAINSFSDEIKYVKFERQKFTKKDKPFPQLTYFLADTSLQIGQNSNKIGLRLMFVDQIVSKNDQDEYTKEVISDMYDLSSRFVSHLYKENRWSIDLPIALSNFVAKGADGNGGVEFDLFINLSKPCLTT